MCIKNHKINKKLSHKTMLKIYILKCQQDKYYVGKTANFSKRYDQHQSGLGSYWTKRYRPIEVMEVFEGTKYDEDKKVWEYMEKYGIDNVRGGIYSQMTLPNELHQCAQRHITGANDGCFNCHQTGHFINDCPSKESRKRKREEDDNDFTLEELDQIEKIEQKELNNYESNNNKKKNDKCFSCGQMGHWSNSCPNINRNQSHSRKRFKSDKCFYCGRVGHWARWCPYKK